jgi:hypothetical protein
MASLSVTCSTTASGGGTITLVGVDGITVISGSSFTTISGFRTEFVAASGFIQNQIDTLVSDHGQLTGLEDDDHQQYARADGSRGFSATVTGVDPVDSDDLSTKFYVDTVSGSLQNAIDTLSSDHGDLTGLEDPNDHPQHPLVDGTRGFLGTVSGVDPVDSDDLATKNYVDTQDVTISGHLQTQITNAASKTLVLEVPTDFEDVFVFFTDVAIIIQSLIPTLLGTTGSDLDWTMRHDPTRDGTGTEIVTGGSTTTLVTSETPITVFNNPSIPADSFIWVETTGLTNVPTEFTITIIYDF